VADALGDPQLAARGSLAEISDAAGKFLVPNAPFQFLATPAAAGPAVSGLGADSGQVLSELLGFSDARIDELRRGGVLSARQS
jgi:crotonobetainyl-CoA:carnitine CoA-transferase CaiB-like acyl-CoA transferase